MMGSVESTIACADDFCFLISQLDSAFQLQEHLAALHFHHTAFNTKPMSRETALLLATPPTGTDKTLWLYELCRFLTAQCNSLIVGFLFDTPPCSATTCPEMRASEWQFLCAVHDAPKSCCAIDYCCHTLDWAANVVTNANIFPSRFVVDAHDKNTALKNLVNVFRRLHRIFAHAWFQHRGVFWSVEGQSGLYVFFKTVCDVYDLLSAENYKLPPEAEGLEATATAAADSAGDKKSSPFSQPPAIAKRETNGRPGGEAADEFSPPSRTNTRRHIKSSPSTGSAVTTVLEADEDDGTGLSGKLRGLRGSAPATVEEEGDHAAAAAMPVLAEHAFVDQPPLRPSSVIPRGAEPESWRSRMLLEPEEPQSQPTEEMGEPGPVVSAEKSNLVAELHLAAAEPVELAPETPEQEQAVQGEAEKDEGEKEEEKGEAEVEGKKEKEEEGKKAEDEAEEEEEEQGNETILPTAAEETAQAEAEGTSAEAERDVEPTAPAAEEPSSEPTADESVKEETAPLETSEIVPEKEAAADASEPEDKSVEEGKSE